MTGGTGSAPRGISTYSLYFALLVHKLVHKSVRYLHILTLLRFTGTQTGTQKRAVSPHTHFTSLYWYTKAWGAWGGVRMEVCDARALSHPQFTAAALLVQKCLRGGLRRCAYGGV